MPLPVTARPADEVLAELDDLQRDDVRWREGRAFTLAYHAGDEVKALADEASRRFSAANALNPDAFPSLRRLQRDVVDIVGRWLDAPPEAAGFVTSGGTESLLMAVKAARTRGRRKGDIVTPNMVLPASAHAAFEKAAAYFGVESRRIAVRQDWRADVDAMAAAMDDDTVLLVGSAPQYPQGVIDPIADIAALADAADVNCHVDACMGGITLPYLRRMGRPVPPWDFEVAGVTSMSVDLHKFGYTTKGASVIVHRDHQRRADQTFVTDNWLGGRYASPSVLGTRGGGPIAAAWAVLQHVGDEGYLRLAQAARRATERL
nr:aspartate aminotransferase family protein [Acidimicrobiia bacterium]